MSSGCPLQSSLGVQSTSCTERGRRGQAATRQQLPDALKSCCATPLAPRSRGSLLQISALLLAAAALCRPAVPYFQPALQWLLS